MATQKDNKFLTMIKGAVSGIKSSASEKKKIKESKSLCLEELKNQRESAPLISRFTGKDYDDKFKQIAVMIKNNQLKEAADCLIQIDDEFGRVKSKLNDQRIKYFEDLTKLKDEASNLANYIPYKFSPQVMDIAKLIDSYSFDLALEKMKLFAAEISEKKKTYQNLCNKLIERQAYLNDDMQSIDPNDAD